MATDDDHTPATARAELDHEVQRALASGRLEHAVTLLWNAHYDGLSRYFVRNGVWHEDVADAIAQVFARVVIEIESFNPTRPTAWLYTLARYELLTVVNDRCRAIARAERLHTQRAALPQATLPGPEAWLQAGEMAGVIDAVRTGLDPVGRCICELLYHDLPDPEVLTRIEATTGQRLTPSALRNRRARLRELVSRRLREEGLL